MRYFATAPARTGTPLSGPWMSQATRRNWPPGSYPQRGTAFTDSFTIRRGRPCG